MDGSQNLYAFFYENSGCHIDCLPVCFENGGGFGLNPINVLMQNLPFLEHKQMSSVLCSSMNSTYLCPYALSSHLCPFPLYVFITIPSIPKWYEILRNPCAFCKLFEATPKLFPLYSSFLTAIETVDGFALTKFE